MAKLFAKSKFGVRVGKKGNVKKFYPKDEVKGISKEAIALLKEKGLIVEGTEDKQDPKTKEGATETK